MNAAKTKQTLYTAGIAILAAVIWNFLPMWLLQDAISEPLRALWIWGVFPLSIPIFYAFFDRFLNRHSALKS